MMICLERNALLRQFSNAVDVWYANVTQLNLGQQQSGACARQVALFKELRSKVDSARDALDDHCRTHGCSTTHTNREEVVLSHSRSAPRPR